MKRDKLLLLYSISILLLATIAAAISCNKKFDAPPVYISPDITATMTIADLKAMHTAGNLDSIKTDIIVEGVVIANDSSGSFYKQVILQDATGGIAVNIDDYSLYTSFPVGRKIYVKMNGLYMNDDNGLMYIGTSPDNDGNLAGIPSRLKDKYLLKGELNVPVTPTEVTVQDLKSDNDKYAYTLIRLNNFEVKTADTAKTYANAINKTDASITVKNCTGDTMVLRNSGFAYFAGIGVPNGNGSLTAIYAYYKSPYNNRITPQVMIRDTSDVQFIDPRCDASQPSAEPVLKSIKDIRALYKGSNIKLGAYKIGGVVISDAASKNISSGAAILQDGSAGISIYFGGAITYNLGDSIVLDINGDSLLNYKGSLEIKTIYGAAKPAPVATGKVIAAKEMTAQQLSENLADIEYTLVKIKGAAAAGGFTYSGNLNLSDASGNIAMYTSPAALFANTSLPAGANDWTGYGSFFGTTKQFQIRNTNDVSNALVITPTGDSDLIISEYVEGSSSNKYIEIYNAGNSAADLSKYEVKLYVNGNTSATSHNTLDQITSRTSLAAGDVIVLSNSGATLNLPAGIVAYASSVCNFNGNDALTLEKDGEVIDVFGEVGTDPGSNWTVAGDAQATVDKTVRRKSIVKRGNTDWAVSAAQEWEVVTDKDDVSGLGVR